MGGNFESNDKDLSVKEEDNDTKDGDHVGSMAGREGCGGINSIASLWVASLGSTNFGKRLIGGGNTHVVSSSSPSQF